MTDLSRKRVPELRKMLAERGLKTSGTRPILLERLRQALDEGQKNTQDEAPQQPVKEAASGNVESSSNGDSGVNNDSRPKNSNATKDGNDENCANRSKDGNNANDDTNARDVDDARNDSITPELSGKRVKELCQLLSLRGLSTSGTRTVLVKRLQLALDEEQKKVQDDVQQLPDKAVADGNLENNSRNYIEALDQKFESAEEESAKTVSESHEERDQETRSNAVVDIKPIDKAQKDEVVVCEVRHEEKTAASVSVTDADTDVPQDVASEAAGESMEDKIKKRQERFGFVAQDVEEKQNKPEGQFRKMAKSTNSRMSDRTEEHSTKSSMKTTTVRDISGTAPPQRRKERFGQQSRDFAAKRVATHNQAVGGMPADPTTLKKRMERFGRGSSQSEPDISKRTQTEPSMRPVQKPRAADGERGKRSEMVNLSTEELERKQKRQKRFHQAQPAAS